MEKLIAKDLKDYENIATFYASNVDKLLDLRNKLYEKLLNSSLFDTEKFSVDFYNQIQKIYKDKFS